MQIATLLPEVQPAARALVHLAADKGITIKIISGTRTYTEQEILYRQGRTTPGPKVTNAPAGYSNHNFGVAFDVGIFLGGKYLEDSPMYQTVGHLGKSLGLEWGGDWLHFLDEPHFQLRPEWARDLTETAMLSAFRQRKDTGIDVFLT